MLSERHDAFIQASFSPRRGHAFIAFIGFAAAFAFIAFIAFMAGAPYFERTRMRCRFVSQFPLGFIREQLTLNALY